MTQLSFTIPLGSEGGSNESLQRLLDNIQVITREDNFAEKVEGRMESLEDKFIGMEARLAKCEDQAGTVEDVLERLNRLSESIEALEGESRDLRERERDDVTEIRDMLDSLSAESRGIMERIDDMDKTNTSFSAQQETAQKESLSLLEESFLKHEEHAADLTEMKRQLKDAARINAMLATKLQEVSDRYEALAKASTEREERSEQIQQNQAVIIQALQDRIKLLESQLSTASSPCPFSPASTSDLGDEPAGQRTGKGDYVMLEKENENLAKRIDELQTENAQLREEMLEEPLTDEEILESSSEDGVSSESLVLPKPVLTAIKTGNSEKETKLVKQVRREKIHRLEQMVDTMREQQREFKARVARIYEEARLRKLEPPRTPYVWLVSAVRMHIERQDMAYSEPFIVQRSGHKMGAVVDFSRAKTGADASIGVYLTMLPGENDSALKWPLRANFKVALVNQLDNRKCYIHSFSDEHDKAFQRPVSNKMFNLCGISHFISVSSLLKPNDKTLYLRGDRLEFHIEVRSTH